MRANDPTVYSSESGRICPNCGVPKAQCRCKSSPQSPPTDGTIRVFRDSRQRNGKTVTLVSGIALPPEELRELTTSLKRLCGCGGAVKEGVIEIQGDHREKVLAELKSRGYKAKLAGG